MNKTLLKITLLLSGLLIGGSLQANLILYDDFSFASSGDLQQSGSGWNKVGGITTHPQFAAGNLSYPGLAASTGNRVELPVAAQIAQIQRPFDPVTSGSVYFSALLNLTTAPTGSGILLNFRGRDSNEAIQLAGDLHYKPDASITGAYNLGVSHRNSNVVYDSTAFTGSDTILVVLRQDVAASTPTALWLNPDASSLGSLSEPTPTLTASASEGLADLRQFMIRTSPSFNGGGYLDEVRVGTTWASVTPVPEPSVYSLFAGIAGLAWAIRRKIRSVIA